MKTLADQFSALQPDQRRVVHFRLCQHALEQWQQYISTQRSLCYVESVVGTQQAVDKYLPADAYEAADQGIDLKNVEQRYWEPMSALQDDDLEWPQPVEFAYYAIYNLFQKYAQKKPIDDWLIVNQALASETDSSQWETRLADALAAVVPKPST